MYVYIYNRAYFRNLGSVSYLPERTLFYEKRALFLKKNGPKIFSLPPCSIRFLSVLHQNKALHNFRK